VVRGELNDGYRMAARSAGTPNPHPSLRPWPGSDCMWQDSRQMLGSPRQGTYPGLGVHPRRLVVVSVINFGHTGQCDDRNGLRAGAVRGKRQQNS